MMRGERVSLVPSKPVAGGRMLARHEGRVVLVAGAIPAEPAVVCIDEVRKDVAMGHVVKVLEPAPTRRASDTDWACGGSLLQHIDYGHQLRLKIEIVRDAFARVGKMPLDGEIPILGSRETGYRMRARLHVRRRAIGFYREGSHQLCDPARTGQLLPSTLAVLDELGSRLSRVDAGISEVEVIENVPAGERVLHAELDHDAAPGAVREVMILEGCTGATTRVRGTREVETLFGSPLVSDPLVDLGLDPADCGDAALRRHVLGFFQGNRYLLAPLVSRIVALVPDGPVVDLYAGAGLFGVALAAAGREVTAVERDPHNVSSLEANARPFATRLRVEAATVESFLAARPMPSGTLVLDPPRTGLSKEARRSILDAAADRIVYVSCDVATLARDARTFVESGYSLASIEAVDLFPNTGHVETIAVFDRAA